MNNLKEIENFEIDCFLQAIHLRFGYDFSDYAKASLKRRIQYRLQQDGLNHISELIPRVLHDEAFFKRFLNDMSITVTEMFRTPLMFKSLRENIVDKLKTYPRINIWHVGCATGEEVYSMAILLHEEGLLEKTRIYATDYNRHSLELAQKGIFALQRMKNYNQAYQLAGGSSSFTDYYSAKYDGAKMKSFLKKRITFAHHNLISDQGFAQMHLIMCRNVLIYFNQQLQNRVLTMLGQSLLQRGFLIIGDKESLEFSPLLDEFDAIDAKLKMFQKRLVFNAG
ncbi:MAG: protein-glutamate O-methyltransferase CheR [Pseudomonadales bacterium]|nr:protein-glutamate O-methyltransferase CheR [Pseudomonadales bacterium]